MYRLDLLRLRLPALRERPEDIRPIAEYYRRRFSSQYDLPRTYLSPKTITWMESYDWPGNIRELQGIVLKELALGVSAHPDSSLAADHTPSSTEMSDRRSFRDAKSDVIKRFERDYLSRSLRSSRGNVSRAAKIAGMDRRYFGKLLKKHGIERRTYESAPLDEQG